MKSFAFAAVACIFSAHAASAAVLTFDDVAAGSGVPMGYGGLNWTNVDILNATTYPSNPSGYHNGRVSGDNVVYIFGSGALSGSAPFSLNDGYFTGAWNDGLIVDVEGYQDGILSFTSNFIVNTSGPSFRTFNWTGLSSVVIKTSGGVDNPSMPGSGRHVAIDNLRINEAVGGAVPEPAAWAMMIAGFGLVGAAMRRGTRARLRPA